MKKIYLGLILLFAFSLTACLGPKQYKYSLSNSKVNSSVVLTARGNKLIKYTADTKIDYSNDKKAAEISVEDARKALKQNFDATYNVEGVKYSFEYTDKKLLILKVEVNYKKSNFKELAKRGLIDRADAKYIDLRATEKNLLSSGYKKVK